MAQATDLLVSRWASAAAAADPAHLAQLRKVLPEVGQLYAQLSLDLQKHAASAGCKRGRPPTDSAAAPGGGDEASLGKRARVAPCSTGPGRRTAEDSSSADAPEEVSCVGALQAATLHGGEVAAPQAAINRACTTVHPYTSLRLRSKSTACPPCPLPMLLR